MIHTHKNFLVIALDIFKAVKALGLLVFPGHLNLIVNLAHKERNIPLKIEAVERVAGSPTLVQVVVSDCVTGKVSVVRDSEHPRPPRVDDRGGVRTVWQEGRPEDGIPGTGADSTTHGTP